MVRCTLLRTNPCSTYGRIIFPATFIKGINLLVTWRVHEFHGAFCCVFFLWLEHLGDTLCNVPLFKYLLEVATATTFTLVCIVFLPLIALLVITCLKHSFELHIEFQHFSETNRQVSMLCPICCTRTVGHSHTPINLTWYILPPPQKKNMSAKNILFLVHALISYFDVKLCWIWLDTKGHPAWIRCVLAEPIFRLMAYGSWTHWRDWNFQFQVFQHLRLNLHESTGIFVIFFGGASKKEVHFRFLPFLQGNWSASHRLVGAKCTKEKLAWWWHVEFWWLRSNHTLQ